MQCRFIAWKQALRTIPVAHALSGVNIAGAAASLFLPGFGMATSLATSKAYSTAQRHQIEQRTRVGLTLMAGSGFDLSEAPLAWWTIDIRKDKPLVDTTMPYATQSLYSVLATAYRGYPAGVAAP